MRTHLHALLAHVNLQRRHQLQVRCRSRPLVGFRNLHGTEGGGGEAAGVGYRRGGQGTL